MSRIDVSHEMVAFVGRGTVQTARWPERPLLMRFDLGEIATVEFAPETIDDADLVFVVAEGACRRLFAAVPDAASWHLPAELRTIAGAIVDCAMAGPARDTLRLAKCIELYCAAFDLWARDALVPVDGGRELSELDARRIAEARRMIDERWHEKLTLDSIARACGLNRAKLTRGFRSMFSTTVADAIAERRLGGAREMLLATNMPVSSIGYKCGYLNNASFTRAFSRRYGVPPTQLRACRMAA